eukprot:scaffold30763_cov76-Phaeocystis_antarctica.AAC.4
MERQRKAPHMQCTQRAELCLVCTRAGADPGGTHSDRTATSAATCDETLGNCSSGRASVRKFTASTVQ